MKKWLIFSMLLIGSLLAGCTPTSPLASKPPKMEIEIDGKSYDTVLGTYCWTRGCVDTIGPIDLLEGEEPIKVQPGEVITLNLKGNTKNVEVHTSLETREGGAEIELNDFQFTAPDEPGIYHYSIGVWWRVPNEPNVSKGDAFYSFKIEVE